MAKKGELTPKQSKFVEEYLIDRNATQAAIRAGYSENTAATIGNENIRKPLIQAAINNGVVKMTERAELTQDYVINNIMQTVDRCSQAEPVRDRDGEETGEYKFEHNGVLKGCELLGKHLKMFTDKIDLGNQDGTPVNLGVTNIVLARNIGFVLQNGLKEAKGE